MVLDTEPIYCAEQVRLRPLQFCHVHCHMTTASW